MPAAENPIHRWDLLVIESNQDTIDALREIIGPELKAAWAGSALEGGNFLRRHDVRVVVCADDLPDLPGLMFFAETRNLWPTTQRVLMCSDLDADLLLHTMREGGILNCLPKPLDREATEHLIEHALRQSRLMESLITTRRQLDEAEVRVANLDASSGRNSRWLAGTGVWLLLWLAAAVLLVIALVLLGFAAIYLIKSYLGVDIFSDIHVLDLLRR